MSVLVVGMSHASAPVAILEKVSMDPEVLSATLTDLVACNSLDEAMILSTCNRVEVYAVTTSFHTGVGEVVKVLHRSSGVPMDTLRQHLYVRYADAAAEHILRVASGLESMVVGEQQIIGQVRGAYQQASEAGTVGPTLHALAQCALHTGKRVHTETSINDAGPSMVTFALEEALRLRGAEDFRGCRALILGAGVMASLAGTHLGRAGVEHIVYANRTRERAATLAEHSRAAGVDASDVDYQQRAGVYGEVDVIVSATGADTHTVTADAVGDRQGRPLTLIDLSMPRDIDDHVAELPGVTLVNIEHLHTQARTTGGGIWDEAEKIVAGELAAYTSAQRVLDVVPAVAALRKHAAGIVAEELTRLDHRTQELDDDTRAQVHQAVRRVVDKLLHEPTVRVKKLAARSATVSYESALQELFGLTTAADTPVRVEVKQLPDHIDGAERIADTWPNTTNPA